MDQVPDGEPSPALAPNCSLHPDSTVSWSPCEEAGLREGKSLGPSVPQIEWLYRLQVLFPWEGEKKKKGAKADFY